MSNQSLREAAQQALECKRLADNYAGAWAACGPGEFATKERDELHGAIDKLAALAQPKTGATCDNDKAQPVARVNKEGFIVEIGDSPLAPGLLLYTAPRPPAEQDAELSDYPPLPRRHCYADDGEECYTADQMRAYIDADRSAHGGAK